MGFFFHALKRADWFRRYRPVGCSCGATHLSGRGCISRENLIANERREKKKRCRSRNAPAFSHLWFPRFLFLKYSFKLASRSSSIPMLSQEKKTKKPPSRRIIPANLLQTTAACWSAVLKWMHAPVARLSVCELQSRSAVDAQIFCVERQTSRIRVVNTHFSPPANYAQTSRRTCMDSRWKSPKVSITAK